jgi:hypothetical protein
MAMLNTDAPRRKTEQYLCLLEGPGPKQTIDTSVNTFLNLAPMDLDLLYAPLPTS